MRIAILGGGFVGLTAAYRLLQKKYKVTLFEKEIVPGGLSRGFRGLNWEWDLERTYHHIFANDLDIIKLAIDTDFKGVFFNKPITSSLYKDIKNNYRTFPVDTPQKFLSFPLLSLPEKVRTGIILLFLKLSPHLTVYEKQTAAQFLKKTMGKRAWEVLWEELFRKKFGKYAEKIITSFIWARVHKRTTKLGYFKGGFQAFINHIEEHIIKLGGELKLNHNVMGLTKKGGVFYVLSGGKMYEYDKVISTLPNPLFTRVAKSILPKHYIRKLNSVTYLHAVNLIIETKKPFLKNEYWVNICDKEIPIMVLVQHTNFIEKKHYNHNHLLYVANYVEKHDKRLLMNKEEFFDYSLFYLKKLGEITDKPEHTYLFKAPFAQPIYDAEYVSNRVGFETPVQNLFLANLEMTYPFDRGTNYAVKLGQEVASLL